MINSRLKTILRELMSVKTPLTGAYLANLNKVTPRTTREDIKMLDDLLRMHGARISSLMGRGYQLEVLDDQKFRSFLRNLSAAEQDSAPMPPKTPEERIKYIIRRLLLCDDYLKLDDLAEEMYISKSTIQNDFKSVKKILNDYGLKIIARPHYGLKVTGSELKLRFCLAEYLFDRDDQKEMLLEPPISFLQKKELDLIFHIIMKQLKQHHITMPDIAVNNLMIHMAITIKRIKDGYSIELYQKEIQEIRKQKEYQVAKDIAKEVEKAFGIQIPPAEVAYITIHLLGTKIISRAGGEAEQMIDGEILRIVKAALAKIDEDLKLNIEGDKELILGLALHLKPAVNRYKFGMNIRNPLLNDIKKNYPLAFEAAIIAGLVIGKETGTVIDENEAGYIALHIGAAIERKKMKSQPKRCLVVCASGHGTAKLIQYKLKSYFGNNLDVAGTSEYYNLQQMPLDDIDFIISSVPIPDSFGIPVLEVNAVLNESDLKKIEQFILKNSQSRKNYFRKDLTFLGKRFRSKEEVLEFLHRTLMEKGLVKQNFLEFVYEREKVAPTSFGNLVAVPHPITPQSEETFLAVCTLEKPVNWSEKPVQLVILFSVKKNSEEDLEEMYNLLVKIIHDPSIVQRLVQADNYGEFIACIEEI